MIVNIAGHPIGGDNPCFIIAEAGVNHNGQPEIAHALVDIAADAGADAVKFQTFRSADLALPDAPKASYQRTDDATDESQLDMLRRLELPEGAYRELSEHAEARGLVFLSTPFEPASVALLRDIGVAAFKLPSGELTNTPFLQEVASIGRPLILSTGMATLSEVEAAMAAIRATGNEEIVLLHCVSCYPAEPADANLRAMRTMSDTFGVPVGWSDHTLGIATAIAAVGLGAAIVEKHFTLDRSMQGPDHRASLEPDQLGLLVNALREAQSALGDGEKTPRACEREIAAVARKSLVAARDLFPGHVLTAADVVSRRPGTGLSPALLAVLVGRELCTSVQSGALLSLDDFA